MSAPASASARLEGLDALRALCMLLVVIAHAGLSFIPGATGFYTHDLFVHPWARWVLDAVRGFSMELFFLLAGYFACGQYARAGVREVARQRLVRIGLPLAVGVLVLAPVEGALSWLALARGVAQADTVVEWRVQPMHLWFLYYLLLVTAAWLATVEACRRLPEGLVRGFTAVLGRALALGLAGPALVLLGAGVFLLGPREQYFDFRPVPLWVLYFGGYFALGWHLRRHPRALEALGSRPAPYWLAALLAFLVLHVAPLERLPRLAQALVVVGALGVYTWSMVRGLLGPALGRTRPLPAWARRLADASYWVYLTHWPVVVLLQVLLADARLPAALKFLLFLAAGLALPLWSYARFVRGTALGRVLDGQPRPAAAPAPLPVRVR